MLNPELEKFVESGKILAQVREHVKTMQVRGRKVLDVCEEVEGKIREFGGRPAFPCNVGINDVAAHYTSPWADSSVVPDGSIVKVDFGVELDGFATDTAIALSLNPAYDSMVVAAEAALQEALTAVAPARKISEIGNLVERCVERYGFKPIRNLTGHKIDRYNLHAGKSVPNVSGIESGRFEVGEVYAVEPFVTLRGAEGAVKDGDFSYIYRFVKAKGAGSKPALQLAEHVRETYKTLPFAPRWIQNSWQQGDFVVAFEELVSKRCVVGYPVLVEASGQPIAQAEHTILVTESGCRVLTG
jgi:methionyl aminopeptidase